MAVEWEGRELLTSLVSLQTCQRDMLRGYMAEESENELEVGVTVH